MPTADRSVGQAVEVPWPLEDDTCPTLHAAITAVRTHRKRKYLLSFADGDTRWSRLRRAGPVEVTPIGSSPRPHYIGSTDPGVARQWVLDQIGCWVRRTGQLRVNTYYMCVGGLSGFDGVETLCAGGVRVDRLVFYDRDPEAVRFAQMIFELIQLCPNRRALLRAMFGRPVCNGLCAANMLQWLHGEVDHQHLAMIERKLPAHLRSLYHKVVQCTACADDAEDGGWVAIPMRRVWPCWGMYRSCGVVKGAIRGGHQETFHYNEAGWLSSSRGYKRIRKLLSCSETNVQFELSDLNSFGCLAPTSQLQVLYISNADQSAKFLNMSREALEEAVAARCGGPLLLVSTTCISLVQSRGNGQSIVERVASRNQAEERPPSGSACCADWGCENELHRLEVRRLLESMNGNEMVGQWDVNATLSLLHE